MPQKKHYRLSVHDFVDFLLPEGDLSAIAVMGRAQEGSLIHRELQKINSHTWHSEIPISYTVESDECILTLEGRIDALSLGDAVILHEIKSTYLDVSALGEGLSAHLLQGKIYSAIYALQNQLQNITLELLYVLLPGKQTHPIRLSLDGPPLIGWLDDCCNQFFLFADSRQAYIHRRNNSLLELVFPYPDYRRGQRQMAGAVYRTIQSGNSLIMQAPTGIGKTIGTLFPALKSMASNNGERIFYLTARNSIKELASASLQILRIHGAIISSIVITAKEKICPFPMLTCDPDVCPHARGFFSRLPRALEDLLAVPTHYSRADLERVAATHDLCPYELSLIIAERCDVIICDYNYAFDPRVHLRRFFDDASDSVLLVDEAHNLVDRARDMFSCSLDKETVMALRRKLPRSNQSASIKMIKTAVSALNHVFISFRNQLKQEGKRDIVLQSTPSELYDNCCQTLEVLFDHLRNGESLDDFSQEFFTLLYACRNYCAAEEAFDGSCRMLVRDSSRNLEAKILCIDPASRLSDIYKKVRSTILFSATLIPQDYFQRLLGAADFSCLQLPSPFPSEHLCVAINRSLSTKYRDREATLSDIADAVKTFVSAHPGNYFVFLPSYTYLNLLAEQFSARYPQHKLICQQTSMSEEEQAAFLMQLQDTSHPKTAFVVMGGMFAEGIDLPGEQLLGGVVVGVGLPMVDFERDQIAVYHHDHDGKGFEYAYALPGFNRVMQAVGRIIRHESDRGAVLLIDTRFQQYRHLMPAWWHPYTVHDNSGLENLLHKFWQESPI